MKKRKHKVQVIFPGDWVEYIHLDYNRLVKKMGRVLEIMADGTLVVCSDSFITRSNVPVWRVIKKYPRFMVLPVPGKIKDEF